MIQNYFKIAWRNLNKNKSFTLINLLGLSTAFAITLLIIQYVRYELSYESVHENADRIVRLTMDYLDGESVTTQDCETNPPTGPLAKAELAQVVDYTRAYPIGEPTLNVKIAEQQYVLEKVFAVDPAFFSMFSYPFIHGSDHQIFEQAGEAVISETAALRLFNKTDVVGEVIEVPGHKKLFNIVGVAENSPSNTHLKFEMVFSYPSMLTEPAINGEVRDNWDGNNTLTYLLLASNTDYEDFTKSLAALSDKLIAEKKLQKERIIGQKISDIHLYSHKTFETEPNGDANSVFFLLGVAFLVIISAFVNYVNLATSKALDRAKEVGLRKVVGATKGQLKIQFLIEALLLNLFAGLLAVFFIFLLYKKFLEVASLPEDYALMNDSWFWMSLGSLVLLSVLLSGAYPAFALSSFRPASVLKGSFAHSSQGAFLRKSLVVFQFAITVILLVQAFTVNQQMNFMRNIDLGVDIQQTLVVRAPAEGELQKNYSVFKEQLLNRSKVDAVALSETVPGEPTSQFSTSTGINLAEKIEEHDYNFYINAIDADYIPLMGMEIVAGQNFRPTTQSDKFELIVNEEAIRLWGITDAKEAIGKIIKMYGRRWTLIGVIKDYHQETAKSAQIPIIHRFNNNRFNQYASVQFSSGNPREQIADIEAVYKANFPGSPFTYFFQDAKYEELYKADDRFQKVFGVLTAFAILIACIGLFGLASFTIVKRTKEIGIRKVIGASTSNVLLLLSKDFIKTVLLSMAIGIPITYFIIKSWLENFANRIEIDAWLFLLPAIMILGLVFLSISVKTLKTALANPVLSLRDE
ncbi:MAG: ABC transporter permease [Bacteroidia bacterium]|nr:ABC transporter permease [Bacteroidia bacterium]